MGIRICLERAGVSRSAAMKMVGHKTESIYKRYLIAEEKMLKEAGATLAARHAEDRRAALRRKQGGVAGAEGVESLYTPGTRVLANAFGILDQAHLDQLESEALSQVRQAYAVLLSGGMVFTNEILRAMHRDWLGGLYAWAGRYRTILLDTRAAQLPAPHLVPARMAWFEGAVLRQETPFVGKSLDEVVTRVARVARVQAEFTAISPFCHGNGRLIRLATGLMAQQAGFALPDYGLAQPEHAEQHSKALREAIGGNRVPFEALIRGALQPNRQG